MRKVIFIVMLAFLTAQLGFGQAAVAKKKQVIKEVTAVKVEKSRGANPNIKTDAPTTDVPVAKQRGNCSIYFDNFTPYIVKVYVDGNYKGTVDAWGGGWVTVGNGYTTVYCVTAGGTYEWTAKGECSDDTIRYKLKPENAN